MANPKRIIVEEKAEENCLARAILIAIAKVDNDKNIRLIVKVGRNVP